MNQVNFKWTEDFQMEVISEFVMFDVSKISVNAEYQRSVESIRLNNLKQSIQNGGYWPHEIVVLNEKFEAVDGNHRVNACRELGIKKIPCTIVKFATKKDEMLFFVLVNKPPSRMATTDNLHAKKVAGHPFAEIVYKLESDEKSLFYNMIAIKGKDVGTRLPIASATYIINTAAFNDTAPWTSKREDIFIKKSVEIGYGKILTDVNDFLEVFYAIFGRSKKDNKVGYYAQTIGAFCMFFSKVKKKGVLDNATSRKAFVDKMKTMYLDAAFMKADQRGKVLWFISHFNVKKAEKNKISFDI